MAYAHSALLGGDKRFLNGRNFVSRTIRRDHLFEDGIHLLTQFGPGPLQIDVSFAGEAGFGSGPTHEFLDLFAKCFARRDLNLWRDASDGEYAFTKIGLFPGPKADPELFYVLGLLCGKAIAMNTPLPLPLSEQFFRFLDNEKLTVRDIDEEFAASLAAKDDLVLLGMPFTYPGFDDLPLIENGEDISVTDENYESYIRLIHEFTCGARLAPVRKQFLKGLFSVIEDGVWGRLTPREKAQLIGGASQEISLRDLEVHVAFEHGYDGRCPQRGMLFETICELNERLRELFVLFVTGCERLPIGGLAGLTPKITVARRIPGQGQSPDETLPTASTCTHYFKLPPYSSKQILRERLVLAITEGSIGFGLS
jgi:hypothetical protein